MTLEELRNETVAPWRLNASLFTVFALLALVIAAVGIGGVLAFSVSQRTNEFGIRMTLGANQQRVLSMVLREGAVLAALGIGIGVAGAVLLSSLMTGLLFEVDPIDPFTFLVVGLVLASVSIVASYIPARRATQVDPLEALRAD
jgi:putative ABC transport system permease protein